MLFLPNAAELPIDVTNNVTQLSRITGTLGVSTPLTYTRLGQVSSFASVRFGASGHAGNHIESSASPTSQDRHRQLCPTAGVHVSPIALGAMSIGDKWAKFGMGAMDKESSFKLLDAYFEAGGNFIDTANNYQNESSEEFIGEWMEKRGNRDQLVIATKYTTDYKNGDNSIPQKTHYAGNNIKSLHLSIKASLKKLRTSYIDILYLHWWDYVTSIEEVMSGLHTLVMQGKVLYLGVSDTPAYIVAKASAYARNMGKTPFVIYQGAWSLLYRDIEREVVHMCQEEGMALAPYDVLASGKIRTDAEEQKRRETGEKGRALLDPNWERNEDERKIAKALEKVAAEVGRRLFKLKVPYVFPIIGGRKVEHLHANIEALEIALQPEHIKYLESILPFDLGFPYNRFGDGTDYHVLYKTAGHFDKWPKPQPIRPTRH
ncbi:Aldo/keto reductase [Panus rudis PR-1116 ss-1]|nr:Aldo/keto reductase [Panus rudis PR-1116 ss-1]